MRLLFTILVLFIPILLTAKSVNYIPIPSKDLVKHAYYMLSYNEKYEQANWVYYSLTDSMVLNSGEERSNSFKMDQLVATGSAKSSDYTKSGYDRGHLCPAADMGFSPISMQESFMMSNVSPQTPDFNRGIWKELETTVREWAKKEHHIYIVTGPIFKDNKGSIGTEEVLVPGYFYKIIYDATDAPKLIAFVLPNEKSNRPLTDFVVSTDAAEKLTGFDFFSQLSDDLETKLESRADLSGWFEGYAPKAPTMLQTNTEIASSNLKFYLVLVIVIGLVVLFVSIRSRRRKRSL
jgi:endonuclease G